MAGKLLLVRAALAALNVRASEDIVFAHFEGATCGYWKTTGESFGSGPVQGTLPGQMSVGGFLGRGLVNSFHAGDDSTGALNSLGYLNPTQS